MIKTDLSDVYRHYIACLNKQDWPKLGQFVHDEVIHNGRRLGLSGYLEMLEGDFAEIPDLHFNVQMLISDPPYIASRLAFDCTPKEMFLGLPVNGRRVSFAENIIYEFRDKKIVQAWSVIDKVAIEAQLYDDRLSRILPQGSLHHAGQCDLSLDSYYGQQPRQKFQQQ